MDKSDLLKTQAFINGEWVDADSGATYEVVDPATGETVATVADLGAAETNRAIEAARVAQESWRAKTAKERGKIMRNWHDLILEATEPLAEIMTLEMGKPIGESRGEIAYAAAFIDWFAEEGKRAYGEVIPTFDASKRLLVLKQPVGVVAAITPWNFPQAMIARKVAPALAAGCAFVVKPARETPLSALAAAELSAQAGLPPGLFNVIPTTSAQEVGLEMTTNPTVRKISFTGSTAVGKKLLEQSASTVKNVSMELGGNAPFIVFDDADIDAAVQGTIDSKMRNGGQTCVCANRIYVQDGVYDEYAKKLANAVAELKVGPGMDEDTQIGPLVSDAAIQKVDELVTEAMQQGANALTGGKRHALGRTYYEVTVMTDVTPDMRISSEEIFGPVAPLYRFSTEEEAIAMANDTQYGLAAYFYSNDSARVWRVSEGLEYGLVAANTGLMSSEVAPFGGFKESGIGREGSHDGLEEFLETKYVAVGGIN